jgi:hypothetical protein
MPQVAAVSKFPVTVLVQGSEEELTHWEGGHVPHRGSMMDFDYRGRWKVVEVNYRVIEPIATKFDEPGAPSRGIIAVHAFVYVEKA